MSDWGGDWTDLKLSILRGYLDAYLKVMKRFRRHYKIGYIDGFAGTGYRRITRQTGDDLLGLGTAEVQSFRDGSARIALGLEPGFDSYVFIEKDAAKCTELMALEPAHAAAEVRVMQGDANEIIQDLCAKDWSHHRAVVFLDPYGMQVDWDTLVALARTEGTDVWMLVPVGIGMRRMLARRLDSIPVKWQQRLDRMLGTSDWRGQFYRGRREIEKATGQYSLFPDSPEQQDEMVRAAQLEDLAKYYLERLATVFPRVAPHPRWLTNSVGTPLYMLCFAVASQNAAAQEIALRIANHLMSGPNAL